MGGALLSVQVKISAQQGSAVSRDLLNFQSASIPGRYCATCHNEHLKTGA
jgi:hypothetical protein